MAEVQPLRALRYERRVAGPLDQLISPPYDVIGPALRERLAARSPYNAVHVDLPAGEDAYEQAAELLATWQMQGGLVRDRQPALWPLEQEYSAPGGQTCRRRGVLARVRVEEYGAGRIRPHERTHPGPREDRLRLTRATRANLSAIFALHPDPNEEVAEVLAAAAATEPFAEARDDEGTRHRLWRLEDVEAVARIGRALTSAELLIADGHHRYETARVYADEVGGEGEHRFVLMYLVALEDPGLSVLPTHRLVRGLDAARQERLAQVIREHFDIAEVSERDIVPPPGAAPLELGYIDAHFQRAFRLRLRDPAVADQVLGGRSQPYRRLDAAVLEGLLLKGALGMTDEDIAHLEGLGYAREGEEALEQVRAGAYQAAFLMRPTPIEQVRAVAASGESMPPKSTYFFPKVPTGLIFSPLE